MIKHFVIYVPGVGDDDVAFQRRIISFWRWYGVVPEVYKMRWSDSSPLKLKFYKLLSRVDELVAEGNRVSLVGVSAGASVAITAYEARKNVLSGVVCICGKMNNAKYIGPKYRKKNPNLVESVEHAEAAIKKLTDDDKRKILSRRALYERVVSKSDNYISGARNSVSPSFGHVFTIAFQITLGAPSFIRFLKKI